MNDSTNTQTPRTDAAEQRDITGLGVVPVDFARQLERELADFRVRTKEIIDEDHERILALIHERDTYKARAEERRALRVEIEQALGMESKPGDTSDDALKQGLATIAALRADLARVTAERDRLWGELNQHRISTDQYAKELDALRARVADYESRLSAVMPADFKDWHENSKSEWPEVAAWCIKNLRARVAELDQKNMILRGAVEAVAAQRQQAEQRVGELEKESVYYHRKANKAAEDLDIAEQRNAELVAALREALSVTTTAPELNLGNYTHDQVSDLNHAMLVVYRVLTDTLARAESATPDHIPDAAKMVSATPAKHCEDCAPEFGCWDGGESCYKQPLQSSTPAKQSPAIDAESLIAACIPGGSICDPQQVADTIREYLRTQEPCGGRCGDPECDLDTTGVTMRTPAPHADTARTHACPECYGGHFKPCQVCGDTGRMEMRAPAPAASVDEEIARRANNGTLDAAMKGGAHD